MQRCFDIEVQNIQRRRENSFKITLAWLLICLMAGVIYSLLSCAYYIFDIELLESDAWFYGILGACTVLLVFPAIYGINRLAYGLYRGGECHVSSIFYAYKNLPRTWLIILIGWLPLLPAVVVIIGTVRLWQELVQLALVRRYVLFQLGICFAVLVLAILLMWVVLRLALRLFLFSAYAFRGDMSLWRALRCSFRCASGRMRRLAAFLVSYIGWFILDCLTLGVLFLLHTAPRFKFDYIKIADILLEREQDHE